MGTLLFAKYEGLGNDFIVLDLAHASDLDPRVVPALCDRRFGIGADGVLLVLPLPRTPPREWSSSTRTERSRRCAGTASGAWPSTLLAARGSKTRSFSSRPTRDRGSASCPGAGRATPPSRSKWAGCACSATGTSRSAKRASPSRIGGRRQPARGHLSRRPSRRPRETGPAHRHETLRSSEERTWSSSRCEGRRSKSVVWGRGVGPTASLCGTGACAAVAVACARKLVAPDSWVQVRLPGGVLHVRHDVTSGETLLPVPRGASFEARLRCRTFPRRHERGPQRRGKQRPRGSIRVLAAATDATILSTIERACSYPRRHPFFFRTNVAEAIRDRERPNSRIWPSSTSGSKGEPPGSRSPLAGRLQPRACLCDCPGAPPRVRESGDALCERRGF